MTVKFSLDWNLKLDPLANKACKACGLYMNQPPVYEKAKNPHIFWVGLSAVQFDEGIEPLPLSPLTRTGMLIEQIENNLNDNLNFYKTNLVKCLPLNNDKIRYPSFPEMEKCYVNFEDELKELNPSIVFLLGKQVSSFILKKNGIMDFNLSGTFKYRTFYFENKIFIPIHHPSYILVYKRKLIKKYINSLKSICLDLQLNSSSKHQFIFRGQCC